MALQMNVSGLRRNIKNIAHNYTDAQVKVREATSNDPWGPSSTIMSEISDLTYNVVAFTEIMHMIWKRLNDHGRNWRHVYKALVLLEYLIKTGSEKVSEQCKENIFAIQTLEQFQFLEENKDMGMNVREKTKTLVSLLKDEERLLNERVRALKAKERFAQTVSGIGSETDINSPSSPTYGDAFVTSTSRPERNSYGAAERPASASEMENARPQTIGEEELQLQLALAMSKEEAEQEEAKIKSDDVRLQMALSQSEMEIRDRNLLKKKSRANALSDLLDINFTANGIARSSAAPPLSPPSSVSNSVVDPWGIPVPPPTQITPTSDKPDPWGLPPAASPRIASPSADPWLPATTQLENLAASELEDEHSDPWAPMKQKAVTSGDPWAPVAESSKQVDPFAPLKPSEHVSNNIDEFDVLSSRDKILKNGSDPMDLSDMERSLGIGSDESKSKSPASFLGKNSSLVNLENLVSAKNLALKGTQVATVDTNDNALGSSIFDFTPEWSAPVKNNLAASPSRNNPFLASAFDAPSSSIVTGANPFNGPPAPNPFQAQQVPKPSMNQMKTMTGTSFAQEDQASTWNRSESSSNNFNDPFSL